MYGECLMAERLADNFAYPPRLMRADRASAYVAMSPSQFLKLVGQGDMPTPIKIHGMTMWDRLELDAAVEDWKVKQEAKPRKRNTVAQALGVEDEDDC